MGHDATGRSWFNEWIGFGPVTGSSLVITAKFALLELATQTVEYIYASIASPGFRTSGTDTPAHRNFPPRLYWPDFEETLMSRGEPLRRAPLTIGVIELADGDFYYSGNNAMGKDWLDGSLYRWQTVELKAGLDTLAYSSHQNIAPILRIEGRPVRSPNGVISIHTASPLLDVSAPAWNARWPGFDTELKTNSTLHVEAGNSDQNLAASEDLHMRIRVTPPSSVSTQGAIWSTRSAVASIEGMSLHVSSSGVLVFRIHDGSSEFEITYTDFDDGNPHDVHVWVDRDAGLLSGEVDAAPFDVDDVDVSTLGAVTTTQKPRLFEETDGGSACQSGYRVDEFNFDTGVGIALAGQSFDELRRQMDSSPGTIRRAGAQYVWGMDEDADTTVHNGYEPGRDAVIETPKNRALEGTASNRDVNYGTTGHNMDATTNYTVWCWFRPDAALGSYEVLVSKKNGINVTAGWVFYIDLNAKLGVQIADGSSSAQIVYTAGVALTDEVWRCGAFVVDRSGELGTAERLYLYLSDSAGQMASVGTPVSTAALGSLTNVLTCLQGASHGGGSPFDGDLSSWGFVAGKALSASELTDLVNIHPSKAILPQLAHYYAFDATDESGGVGTTIHDQVGTADGTVGAGANWVNRDGTITLGTVTDPDQWVSSLTGTFKTINGLYGAGGRTKQAGFGYVERAGVQWIDNEGRDYSSVNANLTYAIVGSFHAGDAMHSILTISEGGRPVEAKPIASSDPALVYYDLANGLIYWRADGSYPLKPIRVTFQGAKIDSGAYTDQNGTILRYILTNYGHLTTAQIPTTAASDLNMFFPYPVGVLIPGGQEKHKTIGDVLEDALGPCSYWGVVHGAGSSGTLGFGCVLHDISGATPEVPITDDEIIENSIEVDESFKPVWSVSVGYARQWEPLGESDFVEGVGRLAAEERLGSEWHWATKTSDLVDPSDGRELRLTSALRDKADAEKLASRFLELFDCTLAVKLSVSRFWWQLAVLSDEAPRPTVVSIQSNDASSLSTVENFIVGSVSYNGPSPGDAPSVSFIAWRSV